ncbi:MAG: hypothetical protein CMI15_15890 [Opitutaceae bacterium]|nr:hypothetical protein [Opitutaceae bacterium]
MNKDQRSNSSRPKVLAISSAGGHWIQMLRLRPAFKGCKVTYATTYADYEHDVPSESFRSIVDANRTQKCKLLISALSILWVILTERPKIILSTGAAPGFFAIFVGKILRRKTIWIDSIANAEELSLSGQKAGKYADLWLTQWEHLAKPGGPHYYGNVLGDEASNEANADTEKTSQQKASTNKDEPLDTERSNISVQQNNYRAKRPIHNISDRRSNSGELQTDPIRYQQLGISDQKSFRVFVTVGSDVPFDRMVKVIDEWAGSHPEAQVFAQVGNSNHEFQNIDTRQFLSPSDFAAKVESASLVIAHAGMGSILSALKLGKPILVMPRLGYLGETRNEHQVATIERLAHMGLIEAAKDEHSLTERLAAFEALTSTGSIAPWASRILTKAIAGFFMSR